VTGTKYNREVVKTGQKGGGLLRRRTIVTGAIQEGVYVLGTKSGGTGMNNVFQ